MVNNVKVYFHLCCLLFSCSFLKTPKSAWPKGLKILRVLWPKFFWSYFSCESQEYTYFCSPVTQSQPLACCQLTSESCSSLEGFQSYCRDPPSCLIDSWLQLRVRGWEPKQAAPTPSSAQHASECWRGRIENSDWQSLLWELSDWRPCDRRVLGLRVNGGQLQHQTKCYSLENIYNFSFKTSP